MRKRSRLYVSEKYEDRIALSSDGMIRRTIVCEVTGLRGEEQRKMMQRREEKGELKKIGLEKKDAIDR